MSVSNVIQVIADHIEPKIYTQKDFVRSILFLVGLNVLSSLCNELTQWLHVVNEYLWKIYEEKLSA